MNTMKNGGPAHPVTEMGAVHAYAMAVSQETEKVGEDKDEAYIAARGAACAGMTLRDHFAAAALQGLIAHYGGRLYINDKDWHTSQPLTAYEMADAMLKARNGGGEG